MYLAPLNYDRFFRKVFSDLDISKRFLEDFFDTTIEEIHELPTERKITDDATAADFKKYENDPVFSEIMRRINKISLRQEDFEYIKDYENFRAGFLRHEASIRSSSYLEGKEEGREEGMKIADRLRQEKTASNCLTLGMRIEDAARISELPVEEVQKIANQLGLKPGS